MGIFNKKKDDAKLDGDLAGQGVEAKAEKVAKASKPAKKASNPGDVKNAVSGVLVSPLITERSASLEALNQYVFVVETSANKSEIIKAFETRYGIKPISVNISNYYGKYKRYGRNWGKTKDWKKAIVTLPKGKSVNVYEGVK